MAKAKREELAGPIYSEVLPIIQKGVATLDLAAANPLPQALILTAIVISFSFLAFLLVLTYRAYQALKTDNTGEMRLAEPEERPLPPLGY